MNAEEAVRLARLAAAAGLPRWVKLEIHPDPRYLLPDPIETLKAAEILVESGLHRLPYINADPVLAKRLQDIGVATVMPLGSPIGSNRGLQTAISFASSSSRRPCPSLWTPVWARQATPPKRWKWAADAVLINTAIAVSNDPNRMAVAFKLAVEAGRAAYEAGLAGRQESASATSPLTAFLD